MALAEHEIAARIDGHRTQSGEAKLLPGKTLENYDFEAVPMISKAQVSALVRRGRLARPRGELTAVRAARRG